MGRTIWTILGVILAIWLAFTAIGGIFATLKTFLITGLIAAVVVIVVSLLAGRPRRGGSVRAAGRWCPAAPKTSGSRPGTLPSTASCGARSPGQG
jgi:hypothetical protein